MGDEGIDQAGQAFGRGSLAGAQESFRQHRAGAMADQMAQIRQIDRAAPVGHQHGIQSAQKVRCGVDQGAVEIEDQAGVHGLGTIRILAQYIVANRHFAGIPRRDIAQHGFPAKQRVKAARA
jgi:hypothetical protein